MKTSFEVKKVKQIFSIPKAAENAKNVLFRKVNLTRYVG